MEVRRERAEARSLGFIHSVVGSLSPEFRSRGTWDPGKAVRKTCSRGLEESKEVKTIGGIRNSFRDAQTC